MTGGPEDPFGSMADLAVTTHEMYLSYVGAGFTEAQAFELTRSVIVATIRNNGPQPGDDR